MSSSRYPDNNRYGRDRSPYRDRRPSTYSAYPPRGSDSNGRPGGDSGGFPPRDTPRGPKSLVDVPRGPISGPPSGAPSAPRDGRDRAFAGRGEAPLLRNAPPLSSSVHPPHNSHNSWRADRDRDRDFDRDRRERRPSPPRRSPIRDSRDARDARDFLPRDLDIPRARRNSRDGPPSAGSTYSDPPPLSTGSSYRGSGIGRGRGGRDFGGDVRGRPRTFHTDDRDRHHDARDRIPDRSYRPRSRSREPVRRERDPRDDRDFDRRDREERRFVPREYDSYIGPAAAAKTGPRPLDTHRPSISSDPRHASGPPPGPGPHSSHHPSPADRLGPPSDTYSRRSSVATEPLSAKESRRDPGRDDPLLASRAEASRERYAPRASSPPAAVPAFGFSSNVWRNPALDTKTGTIATQPPKPVQTTPTTPAAPIPAVAAATVAPAPKPSIPSGLSTVPPTGPKADRVADRPHADPPSQENRLISAPQRAEPSALPPPSTPSSAPSNLTTDNVEPKPTPAPAPVAAPAAQALAHSPPQGPAARPRPPPTGPQAGMRSNVSPSFSRPPHPPYAHRDASPGAIPPALNPRSASGNALSISTSPKSLPANIPTGPKADRAPMAPRPPPMYPPSDRPGFSAPRLPIGQPKSMQWVRPGLNLNRTTLPTKREFPADDRDRSFGTAPKAPKFENSISASESQRTEQAKSESPSVQRASLELERSRVRAASAERMKASSPKPAPIETRRHSDVSMVDMSAVPEKPPVSAVSTASSAAEVLEDSDDDLDLDEDDFAESEAKYNREKALLEAKRVDLSAPHLRVTTLLQEITLLSCLNVDHLPHREVKSADEEMVSIPSVQPPPESITTELPTPKAEEPEDVSMEDKEDKEMAPATRALRLRRETSADQEMTPDLSALPYLGSGPPTPLSDLEQDRLNLPESVMNTLRNRLRETIEPKSSTEDTLQAYANAYRAWRLNILPWEEAREQEDPERPPSVEPGIKVTTPDVSTATMGPLLDQPPPTTGRRGHSSRWASELDLEAVIKESLKTAEEERMGKKDVEPKKSMADPEKEADLPLELTEYEAKRRRFIDTNFQREPGQGIFVFHYEPPEDDFTEDEHKIMVHHYKDQYAKKWGKLAEILYKEAGTSRTYKDCINHYYATKWAREYKGKLKRGRGGGARKRGGGAGRGRGAISNMHQPDAPEDGHPLALTETGRPRRSAAPTFGGTEPVDPDGSTPTPGGRARRATDADGTQEKPGRRTKATKERPGRKPKNAPLAAAAAAAAATTPIPSPVKTDRKEKTLGVKMEDDFSKRPLGEMALPIQPGLAEEQVLLPPDAQPHPVLSANIIERPKTQTSSRPGPSSYWSVSELQDFQKNVAHFGTDWMAIANHMGTKTHTMVKNHYVRLVEGGTVPDLEQFAKEADRKRERGEDLGPPPTPTPAPKRRYESTQAAIPRTLAPTPELRKSPVVHPTTLPKASPPNPAQSARFSAIAQAPAQTKPLVPVPGFPPTDSTLSSGPVTTPQQSPPAPAPPRSQPQHHHQHSFSQHKPHAGGPRAGYFSDDVHPRIENRQPAQPPTATQPPRTIQQHAPQQIRAQDQPQPSLYRGPPIQEQASGARSDIQPEHDTQHRFQARHSRQVSQEMPIHRPFSQSGPAPIIPSVRSTSGAGSPERGPIPLQHARHISHSQPPSQPVPEVAPQVHNAVSAAQQLPPRSAVGTPPVKEEPRPYSLPLAPQSQPLPSMQAPPSMHQQPVPQPTQNAPPPPPKPAPEPRKSNLLSLLNDPEPEEQPRRKKANEQGALSHTSTPQQQTPIAPPPSVGPPMSSRRDPYNDPAASQVPYSRASYAQPTPAPQGTSGRQVVDLTNEQAANARARENWQQGPQYHPSQSQAHQAAPPNAPHPGLSQPPYGDSRMYGNHRSVFAQHNAPRHNPSPPPMASYSNSPHLHSRTPSLSGPPGQPPRHGMSSATPAQHPQAGQASSQILQPNPYAQVDPPGPGGAQASGPVGMRPSPHLHMSHVAQQRDVPSRNEHPSMPNANMPYSNPQTPNEHPGHHIRGQSMAEQQYRRDPRDTRPEFDVRNTERDTGRELSQRSDAMLRESRESLMANPQLRSAVPPPMHEDLRYQSQQPDRGYPTQRSHTPLSRSEHAQHPTLQHPPHSSLGANNHPMYGQRPPEDRYRETFQRDSRIADRIREEQAQQAAMREEYIGREQHELRERDMREREMRDREMRDREMRDRNAQYQESLIRRDGNLGGLRGPPPPGHPGHPQHGQDQRSSGGPMDWTNAVRHPQDRWPR